MSPHSIDPATPTDGFSSKLAVDRRWLQKLLQRHGHSTKEPLYVLAPMVDQSDLPFRLQCRKYGTQLCFTPMVHAKLFTTMIEYERRFTLSNGPAVDRPLIAQICGGNPAQVLECALKLQPYCDGIDINCGCPQGKFKNASPHPDDVSVLKRLFHRTLTPCSRLEPNVQV